MRNYVILKTFCKKIYWVGSGNFWYEEGVIRDDNSIFYKIFNHSLFLTYGFMTLLEILAALIGDFPEDEKSDSITFAVSHTIVMIKIFSVISNKKLVKKLIRDLIKVCELYEDNSLMVEKYRIMKINFVAYVFTVYGCTACFVFEGLRKMSVGYFEKLREDFDKLLEMGNPRRAAKQLTQGLIAGIVMHKELIRISKEIDKAFGTILALQLFQSSGSAVSLLLQIALSDQLTLVAQMKILFFIFALFFLLGLFLCNAGDITYQASLLSDSIFYCGWHSCPSQYPNKARRNLGLLVLQACAQSQRPIVMKAFKMLELTYATFLLVVRGTYSVFALIYAQNQ
ncbi:uncharacterized protein [Maniola hyperantus]|uniref:uncharacterized protein n=1 Tax=Aphantopus hyperantus TaxID=2795564 RepID=UPI00374994D3